MAGPDNSTGSAIDLRAAVAAQALVAKKKARQAADATRRLVALSAQLAEGVDAIGQRTCKDDHDADAVADMVRQALREHREVEVVLMSSPMTTPQPQNAAKETHSATFQELQR